MSRSKALVALALGGIAAGVWWAWQTHAAPTRIALVNYEESSVADLAAAAGEIPVTLVRVAPEDLLDADLTSQDAIFVQAHALRLDEVQREHLRAAADNDTWMLSSGATDPANEMTNLTGELLEQVTGYLNHRGTANRHSLLSLVRQQSGRKLYTGTIAPVEEHPSDGLFHLDEAEAFADVAGYQAFYEASGRFKAEGKRVAILTGFLSPYDPSTRGHFDAVIRDLEARGHNVYPVFGWRQRVDLLEELAPDLVLHFAHGRLAMRGGDAVLPKLARLDVPVLTPLVVVEDRETWLADKQGLSGGMLGQSIVLPELDGGIEPYVVATTQPDEQGFAVVTPIPERIRSLGDRVDNWFFLQDAENAEKKVAIYYYKGTGDNALVASSLEVAPSLYRILQHLQAEGFDTGELPESADAFEDLLMARGPVLGTYAQGSFDDFLAEGDPALVPVQDYLAWAAEDLAPEQWADVERDHGLAPGEHMSVETDDGAALAIARLRFGNVVVLPVPMVGASEAGQAVHGVEGAPAHSYLASYLWVRHGFDADLITHVGTHGSVEFLPGKQVALSHLDWSEALLGDVPHVYLYDVADPGEAMIAKRRSRAVMVTHLTAPFMQADLEGAMVSIDAQVHRLLYSTLSPALKQDLQQQIAKRAEELHLDLDLDGDPEDITGWATELSRHLHELEQAKVGRGRYVLGRPWSDAEIEETVTLATVDRVADARMDLDIHDGVIPASDRDDHHVLEGYRRQAFRDVRAIYAGRATPEQRLPEQHVAAYEAFVAGQAAARQSRHQAHQDTALGRTEDKAATALSEAHSTTLFAVMKPVGLGPTLAAADESALATLEGQLAFYIDNAYLAETLGSEGADGAAVAAILASDAALDQVRAAQAQIGAAQAQLKARQQRQLDATRDLVASLEGVLPMKAALEASTAGELAALTRATSGRWIAPSTGGDPIGNPQAVPTGRNHIGVDTNRLPGEEAWRLGTELADQVIETWTADHGQAPRKIALTFWSSELLRDEGIQLAQAFHLLGVEPVRNRYGRVNDVRLVSREDLGRPRVDVVVQTSGQFRDLAASRIYLLNDAVALAAGSPEEDNPVRDGSVAMEAQLVESGSAPQAARDLSTVRVFGGVNGSYGAQIMGLVESGDRWESEDEIADTYLANMGAIYDEDHWETYVPGAFEGALTGTELVLQPRTSNVYGPLNLDHVYEFMGGVSAASRRVNGTDPEAWFNDMRRRSRLRVQPVKTAIWVEARTTVHHRKWLSEITEEGATALSEIAEITRDLYGWDAMKPAEIDDELWDEHHDVLVRDRHDLGLREHFEDTSPASLQEITAVMLETVRKGMWDASEEQVEELVDLHTELVRDHGAGCSGFVCDNAKLQDFIANKADPALREPYEAAIEQARESGGREGVRLARQQTRLAEATATPPLDPRVALFTVLGLTAVVGGAVVTGARRRG